MALLLLERPMTVSRDPVEPVNLLSAQKDTTDGVTAPQANGVVYGYNANKNGLQTRGGDTHQVTTTSLIRRTWRRKYNQAKDLVVGGSKYVACGHQNGTWVVVRMCSCSVCLYLGILLVGYSSVSLYLGILIVYLCIWVFL